MPVRKVSGGFKWGSKGKLYKGPGAAQKAEAQGRAAFAIGFKEPKQNTVGSLMKTAKNKGGRR